MLIGSLFDETGRGRLTLLFVLLAANAIALPYAGLTHDAELYAGQVVRRLEPAEYAGDLLLDEGVARNLLLFVPLTSLAARAVGLEEAFFILHVASRILFVFGLLAFVDALDCLRDRAWTAVALLLLSLSPGTWGGYGIFSTNEPFLTPRLPAVALSLLGAAWFLRGFRLRAAVALAAALAIHPLMAAGPIATILVLLIIQRGRRLLIAVIAAVVIALALLAVLPSLATQAFGQIDSPWRSIIALATPENCPWLWPVEDLGRLVVRLAVVLAAAQRLTDQGVARFAAAAAAVVAGGFGIAVLAGLEGWALPFQAQLHRAEWLLAIVSIPLALSLLESVRDQRGHPLRLLVPVGAAYTLDTDAFVDLGLLIAVMVLPLAIMAIRGIRPTPRDADWRFRSVVASLIAGLALLGLGRALAIAWFHRLLLADLDGWTAIRILARSPGPIGWTILIVALVMSTRQAIRPARVVLAIAALGAIAAPVVSWFVPRSAAFRAHFDPSARSLELVRTTVATSTHRGEALPIVYWPTSRIGDVWFAIGARCYYSSRQFAGSIFSRELALEAGRRGQRVGAIEAERLRPRLASATARDKRLLDTIYARSPALSSMTVEGLCEDRLDLAVLPAPLDLPPDAVGPGVFVYDCRVGDR